MQEEKILRLIGYLLFVFWLIFTAVNFYTGNFSSVFWFCNLSIILLSLACFQQSLTVTYLLLSMGIIFQLPWIADWILYLTTNYSVFKLGEFYAGLPLYFMILTFIRHLVTVPLIIFILLLYNPEKPKTKVIGIYSLIIIIVMAFSYLIGPAKNLNCARFFCATDLSSAFSGPVYSVIWTAIIIALSLISLYLIAVPIHKLIAHIKKKNKSKWKDI